MDSISLSGDTLEGGGQIVRTAVSLSVVTGFPLHIYNIRAKRPSPGLKAQHLSILKILEEASLGSCQGSQLGAKEIRFIPARQKPAFQSLQVDVGTAGAIGLILQSLLLAAAFSSSGLSLEITGGTAGLGQVPILYYPQVVFPILSRSGLRASLFILRHGYYPKGGGKVKVEIGSIEKGQPIQLSQPGRVIKVEGLSLASKALQEKRVAERQAEAARRALEKLLSCPLDLKYDYVDTYSVGTEINLWAHTDTGAILWADRRGELKKKAEEVGKEAGQALWQEIEGGAACDFRLADNLIPWLALLGGEIKTSQISLHTQTNIWVCEQFLGKIFAVEGTTVRCRQGQKID